MGRLVEDLVTERRAVAQTIASLDPQAPSGCGDWTASDLAIHLVTGEVLAALPNAPFRWLVGHGVRLDWMASMNRRALAHQARRHDREWALLRLAEPIPRLHRIGGVAATSLLEFWAHHEDVLVANHLRPCATAVDLCPVVQVLVRYQRRLLERHAVHLMSAGTVWHSPANEPKVEIDGAPDDIARWLSGRGSIAALNVLGLRQHANALTMEPLHI